MAIDWDKAVLGPLQSVFGEGKQAGGEVMFHPDGGTPYAIDGVFDAAYRDVNLVDPMVDVNTTQPVLGVRFSMFSAEPLPDDQVYVPSTGSMYLIKEVRPDGHDWAKLMLAVM